MAMQQTGTPPKTKRSGVFPHSIRNVVIICSIIVFLIIAVIGAIGIWKNWGIAYNLIFLIFAVGSAIIGVLAFWSSNKPSEGDNPAIPSLTQQTPQAPVQDSSYNNTAHGTRSSAGSLEKPANKFKNVSRGVKLQLSGLERSKLREVLFQAFPDQTEFDDVLQINFNERLNGLVNVNQNYRRILFDLIDKTQAEGWTEALIKAAYDSNQGNEMLGNYYVTYVQNRQAQTIVETGGEAGQTTPGNLDGNNDHSGTTIRASEEGLPDTRRGCIVEAQEYVKKAYDLLNPKLNILPENAVDAIQHLKTVKRDIEQLRTLLQAGPPPNYARIFAEIDTVTDQIDNHLAPSLQPTASPYKNAQNKFQALQEALDNLDTLIPR